MRRLWGASDRVEFLFETRSQMERVKNDFRILFLSHWERRGEGLEKSREVVFDSFLNVPKWEDCYQLGVENGEEDRRHPQHCRCGSRFGR